MPRLSSSPALRWAVPAGAAVAVAAVVAGSGVLAASADPGLAPRSAAQLLADVQRARVDGLSGTVVQRADLGLPEIAGIGGDDSSEFESLIGGTHTMRVWLDGGDKVRLALLGRLGESDFIHNGKDVWVWSSREKTAAHLVLNEQSATARKDSAERQQGSALTPQQAADKALTAVNPTTEVTTGPTGRVAGRAAYELVLKPRAATSLVESVRIALDGQTKVPLRVRVLTKGTADAAFEVGFTSVDFTKPEASQFRFNPPPGTKVEQISASTMGSLVARLQDMANSAKDIPASARPKVVGQGWGAVAVATLPRGMSLTGAAPSADGSSELRDRRDSGPDFTSVLARLPRVSGEWGSGRLLKSRLLTVVLTDDGRVAVGAVTPAAVYAALK